MKVTKDQRPPPGIDDAVERAMIRYWAAQAQYRDVVVRNMELTLNGGERSDLARLDEERAFEALDYARHALFTAAAIAFPTIH
jgi:hypothetical protein